MPLTARGRQQRPRPRGREGFPIHSKAQEGRGEHGKEGRLRQDPAEKELEKRLGLQKKAEEEAKKGAEDRKSAEKRKAEAQKAKADDRRPETRASRRPKRRESPFRVQAKLKAISEDLRKAEAGRKAAQEKAASAKSEADELTKKAENSKTSAESAKKG